MGLKAGHVADFSGSLAEAIDTAMKKEWEAVKNEPMPDTDPRDRRILFVAIAQGLLTYLNDHPADILNSLDYRDGSNTVRNLPIESVDVDVQL